MNREAIEKARATLLQMRREAVQEVHGAGAASRELGQDGVADLGDMSVNSYSREVLYNLSEVQRQRVQDIDAALERLEQGVYGICAECGEEIDPQRLQVRPFSRYCIDCKTDLEKFGSKPV